MNTQKVASFKTVFSERWDLIKPDLLRILRGFLLGLAGALCTYLETNFIGDLRLALSTYLKPELLPLALGVMVAINSSVINALRKLMTKTTYIKQ